MEINSVYSQIYETSAGCSTLRHIKNPIYDDHSNRKMDGNEQSTSHTTKSPDDDDDDDDDDIPLPEYTYATIEVKISHEVISKPKEGDTLRSPDTDIIESEYSLIQEYEHLTHES